MCLTQQVLRSRPKHPILPVLAPTRENIAVCFSLSAEIFIRPESRPDFQEATKIYTPLSAVARKGGGEL